MTKTVGLLLILFATACKEPPAPRYAAVDEPQGAPPKVEGPPPKPLAERTGVDDETIENCGRGTGRLPDGTCERMRLRERPHVQQVQIPGGRFVMGDPPQRYDAGPSRETPHLQWPAQPPRIAEVGSFWLDLTEVSRAQYAKCVDAGECTAAQCPDGEDPTARVAVEVAATLPQTCVSQPQAAAFCRWIDGRLPTHAEWEFAARGPDARPLPWGAQLRDEYHAELVPVGGLQGDVSYFGMRGMGTNAKEWTATLFDPHEAFAPFVTDFRLPDGPLARARAGVPGGHVAKGGRCGTVREETLPAPKLGFRCAGDVDPQEVPLRVPADPPEVPLAYPAGQSLLLFGGVAEAVDHREAQRYCEALTVEFRGRTFDAWALPTLEQVQAIAESFQGPGPFWTAQGAAIQQGAGQRPVPHDPWVALDAGADESLAARCIHLVAP